jgi:hypothetical protein
MAFLAPLAAKGIAGAATTSLGAGLTMGTTLGGLKASASLLAPTLGSTLSSGSLLTGAGGSLLGGGGGSLLAGGAGGLGGLGGLGGTLLPKFASLGGAGGSLLGGGGGSLLAGGAGGLGGLTPGASALLPKFSSLTGTGGLGMVKPGVDLAAVGSKTLNPGQLEQLRASVASVNKAGPLEALKGPTSPIDDLLAGKTQLSFPNANAATSSTEMLGKGLNINAGPAGTLRMPLDLNAPTTGLKVPPITGETPITEGALSVSKFAPPTIDPNKGFLSNAVSFFKNPSGQAAMDYIEQHPYASAAGAYGLYNMMKPKDKGAPEKSPGLIRPYTFDYNPNAEAYATSPTEDSSEQLYFSPTFTAQTPYEAPGPEYRKAAEGGVMGLAVGGPVEAMSAMNSVSGNVNYPQAGINTAMYSNPAMQRPMPTNVVSQGYDTPTDPYTGEMKFAGGGISHLGDYSDGGRLLKGPGDGVSDSIPASIGGRQPARLADGEFVIPARIVSEIGNGSTEAGARKLYAMMDRVQKARSKTVGKKKVAVNTRADKHLPA